MGNHELKYVADDGSVCKTKEEEGDLSYLSGDFFNGATLLKVVAVKRMGSGILKRMVEKVK